MVKMHINFDQRELGAPDSATQLTANLIVTGVVFFAQTAD